MNVRERRLALKARIGNGDTLLVPGAYDALSARLVESSGFEAVYVGSYSTAASMLGLADVGVVTMTEMVAASKAVVNAVSIPVLADAEDGWNHAANIWRTVREFEDAGVSAIHLEDHVFGKHAPVTPVLAPIEEAAGRIRAAVEARQDPAFMIIARTDAPWATKDAEEVIYRLGVLAEAGADILMPAGISPDMLRSIRDRIPGKVLVTDTVGSTLADEQAAGADAVLYYGFTLYAAYSGVKSGLAQLKSTSSAEGIDGIRDSIADLEAGMGYEEFAERNSRFGH
jgi:2-methylisocitrate lyase-like PEP mutase family enzyme